MNEYEFQQAQAQAFIGMIITLIFVAILGGTWRTKVEYSQSNPISGSDHQLISFKEVVKQHHFLGGLVSNGSINVNEIADNSISKEDKIVELNVKSSHTAIDLFATLITFGIYSPMTVEVEGKIMNAN